MPGPHGVSATGAKAVFDAGVSAEAGMGAIAVDSPFGIVMRYADALDVRGPDDQRPRPCCNHAAQAMPCIVIERCCISALAVPGCCQRSSEEIAIGSRCSMSHRPT